MSAVHRARAEDGLHLHFWCPGCDMAHGVRVDPPGWGWNGSLDAPTFTPSVLVRTTRFTPDGKQTFDAWHKAGCHLPPPDFGREDVVCHSFVRDGRIEFLGDSTHALAGQTVPLPPWPYEGEE